MSRSKDKISLRQGILLVITSVFVSVTRIYPGAAAQGAKEAGWLITIPSFFIMIPYVWVLGKIFNKYNRNSLMDILKDVLGKYIGTAVCIQYLAGAILQSTVFLRFSGERIVSTMFPNINISVFLLIILIVVGYALYSSIVVVARMGEIIFPIIVFVFILSFIFSIPSIRIYNLTPVSYGSLIPVLKTSLATTIPFNSYFMAVFFFADSINDKENTFKYGIYTLLFLTITGAIIIIMSIGSLGYTVTQRLSFPYLTTIRNISVLEIFQRLESLAFVIWVLCDFTAIYLASNNSLILITSIFNLKRKTALIIPLLSFEYVFSLYLASNRSELYKFGSTVIAVSEITFLFFLPVLIYLIGKIRGKI